jgi:hypothetical protein
MIINNTININNVYGEDAQKNFTVIRGAQTTIAFDLTTDEIENALISPNSLYVPTTADIVDVLFSLEFTAAYGGTRIGGPNRFVIGQTYIINYHLDSSIPSLYDVDLTTNDNDGSRIEFNFTELGTTPYSVNLTQSKHPLGASFGARFDAYGFPFDSAKYDLMIRLDDGSIIRPIYGNISILSRYAGKSTDYPNS